MHDLMYVCQVIALACFAIGGLALQLPKSKPQNWMCWGFFFVLLSFMIDGVALYLHLHAAHP